ncbi:glycosyltransferase family protein [Aliarcobacter butzleri]|uniref:hypothetical protein n=1 Tax=Aliarcobacter butzleri TaxID=28197 RepID=UPI00191B8F26|nr:hypothetical protein [Aliarcobacter butzleri]
MIFKKVDVIFFVEHKDRELDSIKHIADKLKKMFNYKSVILSVNFHLHYLFLYRPKLVVSFYISSVNHHPIPIIKMLYPDVKYLSMNWEQLLSPINLEFKKPRDKFTKEIIYHIAWDKNYFNYLVENNVKIENVNVTGNISLLLLKQTIDKEKERYYDELDKKYSLSKYKRIIFFPMNLAWAFFNEKDLSSRVQLGYDINTLNEHHELAKMYLKKLLNWVSLSSHILNDYLFVIRPHPYITEDDYIEAFKSFNLNINKNVVISKEYTIKEWLAVSDKIYSNWSTVVYDANLMGLDSSLLSPFPRPKWLNVNWNDQVLNIKDYKKFIEDLKRNNIKESNNSCEDFYKIDENIAIYIDTILNSSNSNKNNKIEIDFKLLIKVFIKNTLKSLSSKYFNYYKINKRERMDYFDVIKY